MFTVYRLFGRRQFISRELLYIGETGNLRNRLRQHELSSRWWHQVDLRSSRYEEYPTEEVALANERLAIEKEHPRYNKTYNHRPAGRGLWPFRQ